MGRHVFRPTVVSVSYKHYKYPSKHVGLVQRGHHYHHLIEVTCFRHDIAEKSLFRVKLQSPIDRSFAVKIYSCLGFVHSVIAEFGYPV
jgi:hypothetical protein